MVKVGSRVRFLPPYMADDKYNKGKKGCSARNEPVEGRVFMVNGKGVMFVEYVVGDVTLRVSFLPFDIGRKVKILE